MAEPASQRADPDIVNSGKSPSTATEGRTRTHQAGSTGWARQWVCLPEMRVKGGSWTARIHGALGTTCGWTVLRDHGSKNRTVAAKTLSGSKQTWRPLWRFLFLFVSKNHLISLYLTFILL